MSSDWADSARLLRRTGFGATGAAVDAAVQAGPAATVTAMLTADPVTDSGAVATPVPSFPAIAPVGKTATKEVRQQRNQQVEAQLKALMSWWLQRMVSVEQPFGEKLTFVWHNHFATAATKVRSATWLAGQNTALRTGGRGNFGDLAYRMLTDAAMLRWLDGEQNTAAAPNENLAREFMELFTLGHGDAYTEQDVREGARALTGWQITADGTTHLVERKHDSGTKTVLGVTGNLDAAGYCGAVLAQPGCARYVATRLWGQLVSGTTPSSPVVNRLVTAYGGGRDLSALLAAMLTAPDFAAARGTSVANPVEWLVGAVRALKVPVPDPKAATKLLAVLRDLGQVPFDPPNVSGWPSGQAWLSTAAADARLAAAAKLARAADLSAVTGSVTARLEAIAYLLGIASWSDRSTAVLRDVAANPGQLVTVALNTPEYLTD